MKRHIRWIIITASVIVMLLALSGIAYGETTLNRSNTIITVYSEGYGTGGEYTYTGSAITPKVRVTYQDVANHYRSTDLKEGKDYTISCSNNVNVGEATVTITGMGNYSGEISKKFTIKKAALVAYGSKVEASVPDATYTGYNITPNITLTFNGKAMKENVDYTVESITAKDAGRYSISVNGKGNFEGSKTVYFTINEKPLSECRVSVSDQKYTGRALRPAVTVYNGSVVVPSSEYSVSYSNNTEIGTATVTVSANYSADNYKGTGTGSFKIKYDIAKCAYTIGKCTYTGSALTPEVTIKQGSKTLTKGTDYLMQVSNNTNAGQGTISITGSGYYLGTVTKTFVIEPKSIALASAVLKLPEEKYLYNGTGFTPDVEVKDGTVALVKDKDYTLKYEKNVNPGYGYAVLTGKGNYGKTQSLKFAIYPSKPKITKVEATDKNTATIKWKKGPAGLKYVVYRNGNEIGTTKKNAVSFTDKKKRTNGKNYAYTIVSVPYNAKALTSETSEAKNCYYLKAPKMSASVSGSRMLTASWSKNKQADGYQLQWSTSAKFTNKKTVTIKNNKTFKKTLSGLSVGRKYYFRVRVYKTVEEEYEVIKPVETVPTETTTETVGVVETTDATQVEPEKETKVKKVKYYSSWSNTAVKAPITASAQSAAS